MPTLKPPNSPNQWAVLIGAIAALLTATGGVISNLAGFWAFPEYVTVDVLDERVESLATLIIDERLDRRDRASALEFQITTTEKRLEAMAFDDPDREDNERVLAMLREELERIEG